MRSAEEKLDSTGRGCASTRNACNHREVCIHRYHDIINKECLYLSSGLKGENIGRIAAAMRVLLHPPSATPHENTLS